MRRLIAVAILVSACAGGAGTGQAATSTSGAGSTTIPAPTTTGGSTSTAPTGPTMTTTPRRLAPDFTLALAEGGVYTLSESGRPVYLVFWAEWCPVCRHELPVVDEISLDYADRVDFVAPAWKSGEEAAFQAAAELFPSGLVKWGLDPDEIIFEMYGVPYQPVTVLIGADQTVVEAWAGVRPQSEIRASIDKLLEVSS